jgi:hypothetical protein
MEVKIRKERQETIYRQRERRRKFIEIVAIIGLAILTLGMIFFVIWLYVQQRK